MVSIDLRVWHSRSLIVFQSANDSSLIFYSSRHALESWRLPSLNHNRSIESCSLEFGFKMLGLKFPTKARHRIIDPDKFVWCITPEMLVSVVAHVRFTLSLNTAALKSSRRVAATRPALQSPTRPHLQI